MTYPGARRLRTRSPEYIQSHTSSSSSSSPSAQSIKPLRQTATWPSSSSSSPRRYTDNGLYAPVESSETAENLKKNINRVRRINIYGRYPVYNTTITAGIDGARYVLRETGFFFRISRFRTARRAPNSKTANKNV